jgi:hypothetical protein
MFAKQIQDCLVLKNDKTEANKDRDLKAMFLQLMKEQLWDKPAECITMYSIRKHINKPKKLLSKMQRTAYEDLQEQMKEKT